MTPARQALKAAIDTRAKAAEVARTAQGRLERAHLLVVTLQEKHDVALAALEAAFDRPAEHIESGGADAAVKAAREALASAEDDLIAASASLGKLADSVDELVYLAQRATLAVTAAVQGVIVAEAVDGLLTEAAEMRTKLDFKYSVLREIWLRSYDTHPEASKRVRNFLNAVEAPFERDQRLVSPAVAAWRAIRLSPFPASKPRRRRLRN